MIDHQSSVDTMASEEKEVMDTAEENVPTENKTRNNSNQKNTDNDSAHHLTKNLPPPISPLNTPQKNGNLEEIHLCFCAPTEEEATKLSKQVPQTTFVGPNPYNKHHFYFSLNLGHQSFQNMKEAIIKDEIKWENFNVIAIDLCSERKTLYPKNKNHCQDCRKSHRKS